MKELVVSGYRPEESHVIVHGVRAIPDAWERKRLACPAGCGNPPPNPSPRWGEDRWGALNDYNLIVCYLQQG
jgi:hypothetical protein